MISIEHSKLDRTLEIPSKFSVCWGPNLGANILSDFVLTSMYLNFSLFDENLFGYSPNRGEQLTILLCLTAYRLCIPCFYLS